MFSLFSNEPEVERLGWDKAQFNLEKFELKVYAVFFILIEAFDE